MKTQTLDALESVCKGLIEVSGMVRADTNEVLPSRDHVEIIRHYDRLRLATARIKLAREALAGMEEELSRVQIPDVMAEHGVKTITIEDVGRVTVSYRFSCSMLDKDAGLMWLRANGHDGIIIETVNSSTLSAFAKSQLEEEGVDLPDEIFKTGTSPYTSITKVK
jgi:hypothetical protein